MKAQLLADMGDSGSRTGEPQEKATPQGERPPVAPEAREQAALRPESVWRHRSAASDDAERPADGARAESPFASERMDWVAEPPRLDVSWLDRWGRRALAWSASALALVLAAGAGLWAYNETRLARTLAVVAGESVGSVPRAGEGGMPAPGAGASPGPASLEMAPSATGTPAASESPPSASLDAPDIHGAEEIQSPPSEGASGEAAAASSRSPPARPPASAAQDREAKPARATVEQTPQDDLSETLRLCRAAGYHASLCLQRGCVATRYGLACKG